MDLTALPGIGPSYSERLRRAGVHDAPALAAAEDLPALAEKTQIPLARLRAFQEHARSVVTIVDDEPDLGIATRGFSHDVDDRAARARDSIAQAARDVRVVVEQKWREVIEAISASSFARRKLFQRRSH